MADGYCFWRMTGAIKTFSEVRAAPALDWHEFGWLVGRESLKS